MMKHCADMVLMVAVAFIVTVIVYHVVKYLTSKSLQKQAVAFKLKIQTNGESISELSTMLRESPNDTGVFERIEDDA